MQLALHARESMRFCHNQRTKDWSVCRPYGKVVDGLLGIPGTKEDILEWDSPRAAYGVVNLFIQPIAFQE